MFTQGSEPAGAAPVSHDGGPALTYRNRKESPVLLAALPFPLQPDLGLGCERQTLGVRKEPSLGGAGTSGSEDTRRTASFEGTGVGAAEGDTKVTEAVLAVADSIAGNFGGLEQKRVQTSVLSANRHF